VCLEELKNGSVNWLAFSLFFRYALPLILQASIDSTILKPGERRTQARVDQLSQEQLEIATKKTENALKKHEAKHGIKNHAATKAIRKLLKQRRELGARGSNRPAAIKLLCAQLERRGLRNPLLNLIGLIRSNVGPHLC
jgi:hypothetical protein